MKKYAKRKSYRQIKKEALEIAERESQRMVDSRPDCPYTKEELAGVYYEHEKNRMICEKEKAANERLEKIFNPKYKSRVVKEPLPGREIMGALILAMGALMIGSVIVTIAEMCS